MYRFRLRVHWIFVPKGPVKNIPALIQIMAWHRPGVYEVVDSSAPGRFEGNFRKVILKLISTIDGWGISYEIALLWLSLDLTDDKWKLVQVN